MLTGCLVWKECECMVRTVLDVPFEQRYAARNAGVKYDSVNKVSYVDGVVPPVARAWAADDYSYARWVEDSMNGVVRPARVGGARFTPRPHQREAADAILRAYREGSAGFLIADSTGLGKTLSIVAGVTAVARSRRCTPVKRLKVLIVCPKGAIPVWRQTLRAYPESACLRPLIINYQQLNKLIKPPSDVVKGKDRRGRKMSVRVKNRRTAANGTPRIRFDVIVFDESHYLKNYKSSAVSLSAATLASLGDEYVRGRKPFVIYSTATPGSSPLNLAIMAPMLAPLISKRTRKHVGPDDWGKFLSLNGFHVKHSRTGWSWITAPWYGANSRDPAERKRHELLVEQSKRSQEEDVKRIGGALASPGAPYLARDPSDVRGWPTQQVEPLYIELDSEHLRAYNEAWGEFRQYLKLKERGQADPKDGLTKRLRFRQKASLLKVPMIAEHAMELVESGKQVFIGCQFLETVDQLEQLFAGKRVKYAEVSGRVPDREEQRQKFQRGEAKIILCTVTEAISCHAGETLPDGSHATSADRVTIIADVRENPNDCIQQMGRCHREGMFSLCEFPLIVDTVDEKVMLGFVDKARNLKTMKNEDDPEYLDKVFSALT